MSKLVLGLVLGAVLGAFDGLTALLYPYPEVRDQIVGIVIGSTVKGIIAGIAIGYFARKVNRLGMGILFGLFVGAVLAFLVAAMNPPHYYLEIMMPGSIVGVILGFATQRYGKRPVQAETPSR